MPNRSLAFFLFAVALIATAALPSQADAYTLVDDDELKLDLSGLAEAGYIVDQPTTGGDLDYGPRVANARLKLNSEFKDYGSITVQTGVTGTSVTLLDAVVAFTAADPFTLELGQFKTPVSHEFLIGAPNLLFFSRAALNSFVPRRRVGTQAEYVFEVTDNLSITPQLGLFQPPDGSIEQPRGALVVGRLLVEPGDEVDIHLSGTEFVFDENNPVNIADPGVGYDQIVNAAVSWENDRWNVHGEGLFVRGPARQVDHVAAGYAHAGHRLGDLDGISYEPSVGYDIFGASNEDPNHRVTGGLNLYINGEQLIATANYRLKVFDGSPGHTGVLQLQGAI